MFELYHDDEMDDTSVRCTFKLDLDLDEIVRENDILLGVKKSKQVLDYYQQLETNN